MESQADQDRRVWWREAKFGLFIHWGLYALAAGSWKGQEVASVGEWIMKRAEIPISEYEQLAVEFNPVNFRAEEWVNLAVAAGMKYIVITAKHHDGFAMFRSECSGYNIVDATPFGRDPMKELAEACDRHGIKLCFYYSQFQDWHHPDAYGNDWDYPDVAGKDYDRYVREKALPQMRELLTQYGSIGLIWYDTPGEITEDQSRQFATVIRELQPGCLINSRVGHGFYDYISTGDNAVPARVFEADWEIPATLNHTWGYKENDHNWKDAGELIRLLVNINRKGGNYLLNVGPRADGTIPEPSIRILQEVGRWVKTNGEAIYGTIPGPEFPYEMAWGDVTHKPGKLYLHIFHWRAAFVLFGLQNRVKKAYLLDSPETSVTVVQHPTHASQKMHRMQIILPQKQPDLMATAATVVVLEYEGELAVDRLQA
jgi:alpha-L-fucosidase